MENTNNKNNNLTTDIDKAMEKDPNKETVTIHRKFHPPIHGVLYTAGETPTTDEMDDVEKWLSDLFEAADMSVNIEDDNIILIDRKFKQPIIFRPFYSTALRQQLGLDNCKDANNNTEKEVIHVDRKFKPNPSVFVPTSLYTALTRGTDVNTEMKRAATRITELENMLFNAIIGWYDDAMESYNGIDDPDFKDRVCENIGISENEYNHICRLGQPESTENE